MKIIYVCPRYLWAGGGSIYLTRRLAAELASRGHDVSIFTDEPEAGTERPGLRDEVPVRTFARDHAVEAEARKKLGLADRRGCYRLAQWLHRSGVLQLRAEGPWCPELGRAETYADADVVCFVNTSTTAFAELGAMAAPNLPRSLTLACPLFHPREALSRWPVHQRYHAAFDRIHTLTAFESDYLERTFGLDRARIRDIGVGDDAWEGPLEDFRAVHGIPGDAPVVLFLGRKVYNKGVVHVIQAMEQVWRERPDARLVLVGFRHNEPGWIEAHIDAIPGAAERTINLDDASEQQREEALAACSVMAAPSINDSFGIVYLNAWRHKKPVIACSDTCCDSYISNQTGGERVGFGDVKAIGGLLVDWLNHPEKARELGESGYRTWMESFRWEHIIDQVEDFHRESPDWT